MSFSTSFCLTNIGNLPSNTTLSFYSNADGYTVPFQTTVPLFSVTGNNCPFTLTGVYDGTTIIKVQTSAGNCCAVINISTNDPCTFCNLGFDTFSSTTISQIVAGNITGSCDANITDYLIEWYDVTNPNSPVLKFTSGHGIIFQYLYTHPLVNTQAINPVLPGIYKPFLRKIIINGIIYSYNGEPGTVQSNLDCFSTITVIVSPLNCSNGTEEGDYSHLFEFSGASNGTQPIPLSTIFQLSVDTNYIAWNFWAYAISDELQMTYYGSHYNNTPIILEWFRVGAAQDFNLRLNVFPKLTYSVDGNYNKVTCLTGLTRSINDYIVISIKPNVTNSKTNFKLQLQCLTTFNCETCLDNYYNTIGYKIVESTISSTPRPCGQNTIDFTVTGCSRNDVLNTDIYKYLSTLSSVTPETFSKTKINDDGVYGAYATYSLSTQSCRLDNGYYPLVCGPVTNNTITFTKDNSGPGGQGNISMTFSNIDDFNAYYDSYNDRLLGMGTISNDPTNLNFYKGVVLRTPIPNDLNSQCGDGENYIEYVIHSSSNVTTGFQNNMHTLNFTMPTITKQIFFSQCQQGCDYYVGYFVDIINSSSTSSTNNRTYINYKGNRFTTPCNQYYKIYLDSTPTIGRTFEQLMTYSKFTNETKPFSADTNGTYSYISSVSATTCDFSRYNLDANFPPDLNFLYYNQAMANYKVSLNNPLNANDFIISALPISNSYYTSLLTGTVPWGVYTYPNPNMYITIYQYVNGVGTVLNPNYFI